MKNLILLAIFLLCCSTYSQTKHEDGLHQEFYKNGILEREGFYKNNERIGIWKDFFENGQLSEVYSYSNDGKLTGEKKTYSLEGNLTSEINLTQKGVLVCKIYSESKKIFAKYSLVEPKLGNWFMKQGLYEEYYDNDTLKVRCTYFNNEINGVWEQNYETGQKEWEVAYTEGFRQGAYKQFYKSGALKASGSCFADYKQGNESQFDEKGNKIWEGEYLNGELHGIWQNYDEGGNVINKLKFNKGEFKKGENLISLNEIEVPDGVLEKAPIYPGCNLPGNSQKKNCMSKELASFIGQKFNTTFARELGLTGKQRIQVIFKIDQTGHVRDIRARAKHRALEAEAVRVIALLPQITPGYARGEAVKVPYSLPIIFDLKIPN